MQSQKGREDPKRGGDEVNQAAPRTSVAADSNHNHRVSRDSGIMASLSLLEHCRGNIALLIGEGANGSSLGGPISIFNGFVKSPTSALRCILRHCSVL